MDTRTDSGAEQKLELDFSTKKSLREAKPRGFFYFPLDSLDVLMYFSKVFKIKSFLNLFKMEVIMKKLLLAGFMVIALWQVNLKSNPIIPEDVLSEIYFENGEWYLLFNDDAFYWNGINSIFDLWIMSDWSVLTIKPDYQPVFVHGLILITKSDLVQPVNISPQAGFISVSWGPYPFYEQQEFSWGIPPGSSVGPVLPGQSINYIVTENSNFQTTWWTVKSSQPHYIGGWGGTSGVFQGNLKDQDNNPVDNAEIKYASPYYMYPNGPFTQLFTNGDGFFTKTVMARNYKIWQILKDDIEFPMNTWVMVEPGTTVTVDLIVDLSVGIISHEKIYRVSVNNYPNPFSEQTTIELKIGHETRFDEGYITVSQMDGSSVSIIPIKPGQFTDHLFRYEWNSNQQKNLPSGQYLISVVMDGVQVASSKMILTR